VKVANPSSQDRTPHGAILFAVLPAAAPYRASGFVLWPQPGRAGNVRLWEWTGLLGRVAELTQLTQLRHEA